MTTTTMSPSTPETTTTMKAELLASCPAINKRTSCGSDVEYVDFNSFQPLFHGDDGNNHKRRRTTLQSLASSIFQEEDNADGLQQEDDDGVVLQLSEELVVLDLPMRRQRIPAAITSRRTLASQRTSHNFNFPQEEEEEPLPPLFLDFVDTSVSALSSSEAAVASSSNKKKKQSKRNVTPPQNQQSLSQWLLPSKQRRGSNNKKKIISSTSLSK